MKILLSPHADDSELFACYTLLRERPTVVLCLPGAPRHGPPEVRAAEFAAAMEIVNCPWVSLLDAPAWGRHLEILDPEHVWAPLPEREGNSDHNLVGELAARLWPDKVTFYTTYTGDRTTLGQQVACDPSWPGIKRQALACYRSQMTHPGTREHFSRPLDEYLVEPEPEGVWD